MIDSEPLIQEDLEQELDDLKGTRNWAEDAVLWSTDWTAETVFLQLMRNNINLDPSFQRRSVWNDTRQSLFIESLILGLPIPQLIMANAKDKKSAFIVIDGKQRLLAIRRFCSNDPDSGFEPLKLKGLKELGRLHGKTYADLKENEEFAEDRAAFENASIRTVVIRNWQDEEYLYDVFLRINTGSVRLSSQELRQALHPGLFSKFIDEASTNSNELKLALNLEKPDFRMRDAEILLRYISYRNFIEEYSGNLKKFLDEATRKLNIDWDEKETEIKEQVEEMEMALAFSRKVFGEENYLRKWNGDGFESKKNKTIFDIMLHYFSQKKVRDNLNGKHEDIVEKFKDLCENKKEFRSAIETTTKSIESNRARFNIWGDTIAKISGIDVSDLKFPEEEVVV